MAATLGLDSQAPTPNHGQIPARSGGTGRPGVSSRIRSLACIGRYDQIISKGSPVARPSSTFSAASLLHCIRWKLQPSEEQSLISACFPQESGASIDSQWFWESSREHLSLCLSSSFRSAKHVLSMTLTLNSIRCPHGQAKIDVKI